MHSAHQIGGILGDQIDSSFGLGRQNNGSLPASLMISNDRIAPMSASMALVFKD